MDDERGIWEYENPDEHGSPNDISVIRTEYGLLVTVLEEFAIDSYNEVFKCAIAIPLGKARELAAWLNEMVK